MTTLKENVKTQLQSAKRYCETVFARDYVNDEWSDSAIAAENYTSGLRSLDDLMPTDDAFATKQAFEDLRLALDAYRRSVSDYGFQLTAREVAGVIKALDAAAERQFGDSEPPWCKAETMGSDDQEATLWFDLPPSSIQ